jgi:CAAX protease family protein
MINESISAFLQVFVFTLIPFGIYLIQKNTRKGFFDAIGIYKSPVKANFLAIFVSAFFIIGGVGLALLNEDIRQMLIDPKSVSGKIRAMGLSVESISILLLLAWIKTSLAEEILFRGFIAKKAFKWLGFQAGNIFQAVIFALVHLVLFWAITSASYFFLIFIFLISGTAAFLIGFVMERYGNGSIVPGWIAHGLGNMVSYFVVAFLI